MATVAPGVNPHRHEANVKTPQKTAPTGNQTQDFLAVRSAWQWLDNDNGFYSFTCIACKLHKVSTPSSEHTFTLKQSWEGSYHSLNTVKKYTTMLSCVRVVDRVDTVYKHAMIWLYNLFGLKPFCMSVQIELLVTYSDLLCLQKNFVCCYSSKVFKIKTTQMNRYVSSTAMKLCTFSNDQKRENNFNKNEIKWWPLPLHAIYMTSPEPWYSVRHYRIAKISTRKKMWKNM